VSSLGIGGIVFFVVFAGALVGLFLRSLLPEHHLSPDSKDVVKLGMALIATVAALVLSLLISSAKASYDTQTAALRQIAADAIFLDRILARYGPETKDARMVLRNNVALMLDQISPAAGLASGQAARERLYDVIDALAPVSEPQRALRAQALTIAAEAARTRWLLLEQRDGGIPTPFLVILTLWLAIIFGSFGLYAPRNATIVATFFVCSLSVAGAMLLVIELDRPFSGLIQIPTTSMRNALALIGR